MHRDWQDIVYDWAIKNQYTMAKYDYLCKLSPEIEKAIIKDKAKHHKDERPFSLNAIINALLEEHYNLKK